MVRLFGSGTAGPIRYFFRVCLNWCRRDRCAVPALSVVGDRKRKRMTTITMKPEIAPYASSQFETVVQFMAEAFVTNPIHVAAFGGEKLKQNRLFFEIGLTHMFTSTSFVARLDGKLCGYMHFGAWPNCLPKTDEIEAAGDSIFKPLGKSVPRVVQWFSTWSNYDPPEPHLHLAPIGVAPEVQGKGVGTAMMNYYCETIDREGVGGYLETDRPENVNFYRKFGFEVQREESLIGTPIWYMWRPIQGA